MGTFLPIPVLAMTEGGSKGAKLDAAFLSLSRSADAEGLATGFQPPALTVTMLVSGTSAVNTP